MKYDFDRQVNRIGTQAIKWEFSGEKRNPVHLRPTDMCAGEAGVLPMWIADMDFPCPQPVVDVLVARAGHGFYGYTDTPDSYYASIVGWMKRRHGWEVDPEWICTTPGVVPALNFLVQTFVSNGEQVLIQPPVYHPFFSAIENNAAFVTGNPLVLKDRRYHMDFNDLAERVSDPKVKMAILCNPHNPVGRVWTRQELLRFGELCLKNNVLIVSDEIYADIVYQGKIFTPFAALGEAYTQQAIICTAPSKTFNLAGLQTSNIVIPNPELRARFLRTLEKQGLFGIGVFGGVALEAAYLHGEEWLEQVLVYLEENLNYLESYLDHDIPGIRLISPEGTYLAWLDCRGLGLEQAELKKLMLKEARLHLEDGAVYGQEGEGFMRMNIACPRSILVEALERIRAAIEARGLTEEISSYPQASPPWP